MLLRRAVSSSSYLTQPNFSFRETNLTYIIVFPVGNGDQHFQQYHLDKTKAYTEEGAFSRAYQPAERAGSEEDIAGITLYMTSRAGAFLNGSVILVDGGKLATMPASY
jgi:NAD(P)-dependent dehydrogenase (short-subunit alcohol dehydrogenase family)